MKTLSPSQLSLISFTTCGIEVTSVTPKDGSSSMTFWRITREKSKASRLLSSGSSSSNTWNVQALSLQGNKNMLLICWSSSCDKLKRTSKEFQRKSHNNPFLADTSPATFLHLHYSRSSPGLQPLPPHPSRVAPAAGARQPGAGRRPSGAWSRRGASRCSAAGRGEVDPIGRSARPAGKASSPRKLSSFCENFQFFPSFSWCNKWFESWEASKSLPSCCLEFQHKNPMLQASPLQERCSRLEEIPKPSTSSGSHDYTNLPSQSVSHSIPIDHKLQS